MIKKFRQWQLDEIRLFHGTLKDNVPSIKQNWLQPQHGKFSSQHHDESPDKQAIHLAHRKHIRNALWAMKWHIGNKLKKSPHNVDHHDIEQHGALILVNTDKHENDEIYHIDKSDRSDGRPENITYGHKIDDYPHTVEPGDHYSTSDVRPSGVLTGKRLRRYVSGWGF